MTKTEMLMAKSSGAGRSLRRNDMTNDMTNAEAIEMIQNYMKLHHDYLSGEYRKALKKAIKALEQEPIFDKIYADIQKLRGCTCSCSDGIIDDVEDIIDKY